MTLIVPKLQIYIDSSEVVDGELIKKLVEKYADEKIEFAKLKE